MSDYFSDNYTEDHCMYQNRQILLCILQSWQQMMMFWKEDRSKYLVTSRNHELHRECINLCQVGLSIEIKISDIYGSHDIY